MKTKLPFDWAGMHVTLETEPEAKDIQFLGDRLHEFNVQETGILDGKLLGLFVRDADESLLGGAFGWSWGGTCHIRYLFLPAEMRHQGHGTKLMYAIETEAKRRGCQQIVLDTYSFQAPGFYERLGFNIVNRIADDPRGYQFLRLVKRLS